MNTKQINAVLPRPAARPLPAGACDTHNHVFGPFDAFPLVYPPKHAMPLAPVETFLQMLDLAGLDRGVLVQPTQQDCRVDVMLDALGKSAGRLRGVAAARRDATDAELERMQRAGVAGLRFVEAPLPSGAPRPGAVGFDEIAALASRMQELDWSISVWARMPTLMENLDKLLRPGIPVVVEHMGMLDPGEGVQGAHFQTVLALLREGRIWVKVSVCRCSNQAPDYADLQPFTAALLEANPEQLLWGSDWPFVRMQGMEPDVSALLELLADWIHDPVLEQKVLSDNPARLFGFRSNQGK
jgi:predicted TIM-barrel fold metal-dependent hydrolase